MEAFPALHMTSISWITVELTGDVNHLWREILRNHKPKNAFARASCNSQDKLEGAKLKRGRDKRFPWTQRSSPVDFHSWKMLPWKNQEAVFLWWVSHAMLWFVEGSGGESHLWTLSRSCFSGRMRKTPWSALTRLDDKRFAWSTSMAVCSMATFASFPSE